MTSSTTPEVCAESAEGADLQIPDFTPSDVTWGWTADHYRGILGGATGITKLAESAVSPLVAAARGYSSATKTNREAAALELGVTGGFRAGRGFMLGQATVAGEALVMPWYSLTAVTTAATTGHDLTATTYQARPQVPAKAKAGRKSPKYLMPKGEGTVVATHPSTPMEWITGAPAFMVVEGLIKADAALTAQLRGVATYEELTNVHYGSRAAARASLTEIMGRLPAVDRCLIVEIPACWTWTEKGDWYSLPAEGREAWIGLDGDLATKNQVWSAAKAMYTYLRKKGASAVKVLALPVTDTSNGIDDFMAEGGTWSGALGLLGELPPRPEITGWTAGFQMGRVDVEEGITYVIEKKPNPDGSPGEPQKKALAEMAVKIEEVTTVRSPVPGTHLSTSARGTTTWAQRDENGNQVDVGEAIFNDVDLSILDGGSNTLTKIMTTFSDGQGVGAHFPRTNASPVLDAWRSTASTAKRTITLLSTGVWVLDGEVVWATADGCLTASGLSDKLKARVTEQPRTSIPYVDPARDARELTDAFETFSELRGAYSAPMRAIFPAKLGATLALAAGVHPKGGIAIFAEPDSGKTIEAYCFGSMYGPEWGSNPAVKLEGSEAGLRAQFFAGNSQLLAIDDAKDSGSARKRQNEAMRAVVEQVIRVSYESNSKHLKNVRNAAGDWVLEARRPDAMRVGVVSGEKIEELALQRSTVSRLLSFTVDVAAGETFLATRGQIEPLRRRLVESQAGSKILGAFIVHSMRQAQGSEDPRNGLGARIRELAEVHNQVLGTGVGAPGERARDFLVPVVAALHSFSEMIAAAYRSQGRESLAARVEESVGKDREDLLVAWKRHRSLYGEKAERAASINVVQAVTAAIASGKARFGYEPDSNPQCLPIGRILKNSDIFLLADPVTAVLQNMGQRDATKDLVIKALGDIAKSDSQWVGHGKGAGNVRGWRITPEDWARAQDLTRPSEPEQDAVVEADPPREPTLSLVAEGAPSVVQTLQLNGRTVTWDGNIIKSPGRPDRRTVIDDGWEIVVEAA